MRFLLASLEPKEATLRGILIKMCSENIQQIYRRTIMSKFGFNNFARERY